MLKINAGSSRLGVAQTALLLLLLLLGCTQVYGSSVAAHGYKRHGASADHDHDHDHEGEELECSASGADDWEKGLHIGAIFIILAVGGLGAYLPVLGRYVPVLRIPRTALTLGKFLGTGVIISTALIHMLPAGDANLNNPCVGGRMGSYSGWPGVLVMMAIFAMHLMEFLLSNHAMGKHAHAHGLPVDLEQQAQAQGHGHGHGSSSASASLTPAVADGRKLSMGSQDAVQESQENCDAVAVHTHHTHVHGLPFISSDSASSIVAHKHRLSTYILELGICLHSVIIGVTLSVSTGTEFKTLLIAICFHQFCEGLALGSRIAQIKYKRHGFLRAALSSAVFTFITPLGMVIGIGVRYSYQPSSPGALISMGVLDSLSAGILIYTGLVNLLAEEFGTLEFRNYRRVLKAACFIACFVGAAIMAVIGKWA
ncbi:hypothetical protein LPJ56_000177 [Coemansia sp. RSA 2599]|nr:hypothetical protein LPJ56_000177 [Coemansia sp. RSA 2599]